MTNSEPERISVLFEDMNVKGLSHPAAAGWDGQGFLRNTMADDADFTLPFCQTKNLAAPSPYVFRPASDDYNTFWETRYLMIVSLTNMPNTAHVDLIIYPRVRNPPEMDNVTFSTDMPMEILRETLHREKRRELPQQ